MAGGYDAGTDTSTMDGKEDRNTNDSVVALYGAAPAQLEETPPGDENGGAPPPKPKKI